MSLPVNVMQVVHDLDYGGMQRVVVDLSLRVNSSRFRMHVCCLNGFGPLANELDQEGIPRFLVRKKPGVDVTLPPRLAKLFRTLRIQIVHTHGTNPFFYGTIAALLGGRPALVQTDHARGIFPVARREMLSEKVLSWFADRIVAVSQGVKDDLLRYEHIAPSKIQVIYNGIDEERCRSGTDPASKRAELGLPPDAVVVGVGVRLAEQKGISYLIQAFAQMAPQHPRLRLLVVGDGPLRPRLQKLAEDLGVQDRVLFTGFRSDMGELLQTVDIYALPSLWEGHPLVLLEAMAAGTPVVATDIPGSREVIVPGQTGLLVPPRDPHRLAQALLLLASDAPLRKRMGEEGRRVFLERFTVDRMAREYEALYESSLAAHLRQQSVGR